MTQILTNEQQYIVDAPISERRKQAFLESYISDRTKSNTTEKLFRRAGAFERHTSEGEHLHGFNVLLNKGPFVERSNWIEYRTWEFAVAQERRALQDLQDLFGSVEKRSAVEKSWDQILSTVDRWYDEMRGSGLTPSVLAISGNLDIDFLVEFSMKNWGLAHWDLSDDLRTALWIHGTYKELPLLLLRQSAETSIYLVDLGKLARFVKFDPEIDFELEGFSAQTAREHLAQNSDFVKVPDVENPTFEEKVAFLQTRAWLRLYERYEIQLENPQALIAAPLNL